MGVRENGLNVFPAAHYSPWSTLAQVLKHVLIVGTLQGRTSAALNMAQGVSSVALWPTQIVSFGLAAPGWMYIPAGQHTGLGAGFAFAQRIFAVSHRPLPGLGSHPSLATEWIVHDCFPLQSISIIPLAPGSSMSGCLTKFVAVPMGQPNC